MTDKRILVVTGGALGDVLFHAGFMRALYQKYNKKLIIACKKPREIKKLFEHIDFVDSVVGLSIDQDVSGKISFPAVVKLFRDCDVDDAWIFHHSLGISVAAMLAGIKNRYGYSPKGKWTHLFQTETVRLPKDSPPPFFFHRGKALMDHMGVACDLDQVQLRQPDSVVAEARRKTGLSADETLIALGLNTSTVTRQWGGENFLALARRMAEYHDGKFLIFGAGDVASYAAPLRDSADLGHRMVDLTTTKMTTAESHALLQDCRFYVGNDSFGLNLAGMSSIPVIGAFRNGYPFALNNWMKIVISPSNEAKDVPLDDVWQAVQPYLTAP